ncbi:MAG: hypothetical protein H0U66_05865 [Gemmatimonadaceae bacterium]|nr:hypothetical protein [Gemmatimonadaceae bacterium]
MKARKTALAMMTMCAGAMLVMACSHGAKSSADVAPATSLPAANTAEPVAPAPTPASANPALVAPASTTIKPSKLTYVARLFSEGQAHKLGWRTLEVSDATYEGKPAWLLSESRKINTITLTDSLYVAKVTLDPVHRVVHTADQDITTHYTRDSILTRFEGDSGGGVKVSMKNEPNLVGNIYWIEPLFASVPFAPGWKGRATTVFIGPRDQAHVVMNLWVTGQDSLEVPDGKFDCWRVTLQVGETEEHLWVRKSDRVMLKMDTPVAGIAAAKVELLLAAGQTPKS